MVKKLKLMMMIDSVRRLSNEGTSLIFYKEAEGIVLRGSQTDTYFSLEITRASQIEKEVFPRCSRTFQNIVESQR